MSYSIVGLTFCLEFWNFIWQLEMNMQIKQIIETQLRDVESGYIENYNI